MFIN
ncbi:phage head-tail adapter protein, partial [Escherichia coli]|jgi:hypothetical protein